MATDPRFLPPTPFRRLVATHAASMAGDASIAASLAGSLFFSTPTAESRGKVLLYLLVTMAPFSIVAPVLGPAVDRRRGGRRLLVVLSAVGRAVLCVLMAQYISKPAPEGLLVYPLAFLVLVLAKGYSVAKSSLVPALVGGDDELVRANSRLALVSVIATTVGGGPSFLVQQLFGAEWSLLVATAIFAAAAVLGLKIPKTALQPDPRQARLEREELHQPSIQLAGSAMAVLRGAVGFLAFFTAFSLKSDLFALGVAATMAIAGGFAGTLAAPWLRRHAREEAILAASLLTTGGAVLVSSLMSKTLGFALAGLAVAIGASAGKLGFDSLLQRDGPDAVRGRAFARFETRFQVAWVIGAMFGILPLAMEIGLVTLALVLGFAGISYLASLRRIRGGRPTRTTLRPEAVDRALGQARRSLADRLRRRAPATPADVPSRPPSVAPKSAPPAPQPVPDRGSGAGPASPRDGLEPPEAFPGGS